MPNRFQSSLWFILTAAALTAGAGTGMHMLFEDRNESAVADSDCDTRKTGQEKRQDDWGKIFDGLSA